MASPNIIRKNKINAGHLMMISLILCKVEFIMITNIFSVLGDHVIALQ